MARVITPAEVLAAAEAVMFRPWDWSRGWHCLGDASDVFEALWGVDPMAGLRGAARTYGGWRRLTTGAGGLRNLLTPAFRSAGLYSSSEETGQIGIVPTNDPGFGGKAVAICVQPGRWVGKAKEGLCVIDWHVGGWSCPG